MFIQIPFLFNKKFKKETELKYAASRFKSGEFKFKTLKRESRFITLNALFDKTQEVFGRFFAATLVAGSTSSLFYAIRLFQLPFAILSLPITRGINPELNRLKAQQDYHRFNVAYNKGLSLYILLFIPVTVLLIIIAPELVDLVYQRGHFDSRSLELTVSAFMMYAVGLLPMSLVGYYKRVLSLFDKNKYALYISIIGAVLNIAFMLILVKTTTMGHSGIALASSLSFTVNMFVMGRYLQKELKDFVKTQAQSFLNTILISMLGGFIAAVFYYFDWFYFSTKSASLLSIAIKSILIFAIFGFVYFLNRNLKAILLSFFRK